MRFRGVDALATGRADERVVVQRGDDGDAKLLRHPCHIEREIDQVMYVQDVRTRRVQHVPQLGVDPLRGVRLRKAAKFPVVHELDDCQPVVPAPSERAMR